MRMRLLLVILLAGCGQGGDASRQEVLASTRGEPARGAVAIAKYGCGACHVIPGVERARGMVGPPLIDFAQRAYIAGQVVNTPANLVAWIQAPDSIEPGTVMPTLGVGKQEARDIAAYLYLETGTEVLGPPHPLPASLLERE